MRTRRRLLTALSALLVLTALLAPSVAAEPPTDDPELAAAYGARWLASQVSDGGYIEGPGGTPAAGPTLQAAVGMALAGVEEETFDDIVAWLEANVEDVIVSFGADSPGAIGYVLMVADAAGADATNFGGVNLVQRLGDTLGALEPGLYGASDPTFDGVFRQSLAILGLRSVGVAVPADALDWLVDQQCDGLSPATAVGGWTSYRSDVNVACPAPDPVMFVGPETNSTALAIQALAAAGVAPEVDPLPFLDAAQESDGGWAFIPGLVVDPNSTALVIQALIAEGEDPAAWTAPGGDPWSSLLSWQLGCDADPVDVGAFTSPFSGGFPDQFATLQAVWGASGQALPGDGGPFGPTPVPCEAPPPPPTPSSSTTTPTSTSTSSSTASTGTLGQAASANPTAPRLTG